MQENNIKKIYEKIDTNEEMDERIQKGIEEKMNHGTINKSKKWYRTAVAVIFVVIVGVGILQIPAVSAKAEELWKSFTSVLWFGDKSIEMIGEYIQIRSDAETERKKFDTITEIEDTLGVKILKSEDAFGDADYLFTYTPYVTDGQIYGAMIQNDFYFTGDLQYVEVDTHKKESVSNNIRYCDGKEYKSPVFMQATIRTDNEEAADYENHELEYAGSNWDLPDNAKEEVYKCRSLGIKVVIYTAETDGPWDDDVEKITVMQFIYEGIEYIYGGDVSYETMKMIADRLKY